MKCSYIVAPAPDGYHVGLTGNFDSNVKYLKTLGYDGIEIALKDINAVDTVSVLETIQKYGLTIPAVLGTGRFMKEQGLTLSDKNESLRIKAIEKQKKIIDFCASIHSHCVIGMSVGRYNELSFEDDFIRLVESLKECGEYAKRKNSTILIEPLDRFVPSMIQKTDDALRLIHEVDSEYVRLLLDVFHIEIEEENVSDSIRKAEGCIGHFHIADSNRNVPGKGTFKLLTVIQALQDINYNGFITAELTEDIDQFAAAADTMSFFTEVEIK